MVEEVDDIQKALDTIEKIEETTAKNGSETIEIKRKKCLCPTCGVLHVKKGK